MPRHRILFGLAASGALAIGLAFGGTPVGAAKAAVAKVSASPGSRPHVTSTARTPRTAAAADYVVGVDAPTPAGHNVQFVDFFPRSGLTVTTNQVIDFTWDPGLSPDSFHSATLLAPGTTPATDVSFVAPEENNSESTPLYTPFAAFAPTDFTCGDSANPCAFDGTANLSSGAMPGGSDFFVKITAAPASPTAYTFHCRVHPFMQGTFTVVPSGSPTSSASAVDAAAASQYVSDTAGILDAIDAANHGAYVTNPDGTHHVTIWAGTETQYAEALEMLPANVRVAPGDSVTWKAAEMAEVHTVTFPQGHASDSVDPFRLPPECEASPDTNPDTPANPAGAPNTWCPSGNPGDIEFPLDPAPHGSTSLSNPSDVASSGIISSIPGAGFPSQYSFTFNGNGAYHYQCRVHDNMAGTIFVAPSPGYLNVAGDGGVFAHGLASFSGSAGALKLNKPVVGIASTPDPGYVLAASDGGIFAYGDAPFKGSMGGTRLNQPVVGVAMTPSGGGYWMVASDGGIFNFGDAPFEGSTGAMRLNKPVVGMASTPSGNGYWLVASDGGVFSFGDAVYHGGMGGKTINKPVVGMASTPSGNGYWLVASDGGVFAFGDAAFHGSAGALTLAKPVVGMASDLGGLGYWLVASDGGIFAYGDAPFRGSEGATKLNAPVVGIQGR